MNGSIMVTRLIIITIVIITILVIILIYIYKAHEKHGFSIHNRTSGEFVRMHEIDTINYYNHQIRCPIEPLSGHKQRMTTPTRCAERG